MQKHWLNAMASRVAPKPSNGDPPKIHVELFFPEVSEDDDEAVCGNACSIHYNGKVFLSRKKFSRSQWTFRSMPLTDEQYERVENYCKEKVGSRFNHLGYFLQPLNKYIDVRYDWPVSMGHYGARYFCSEICIEALKAGDVLSSNVKSNIHPEEMFRLLEDETTSASVRDITKLSLQF
jgi:hypothetical protein